MLNNEYYILVMLQECLDGLNIYLDGIYVDVIFGGGGYFCVIFEWFFLKGQFILFDQDLDVVKNVWLVLNFYFVLVNFVYVKNYFCVMGFCQVDGILVDLGVFFYQFDDVRCGFFICGDEVFDMCMDQKSDFIVVKVVVIYDEEQLVKIFCIYGEVVYLYKVVVEIVKYCFRGKIIIIGELLELICFMVLKFKEYKFFVQIFQVLCIEVNVEMDVLEKFFL